MVTEIERRIAAAKERRGQTYLGQSEGIDSDFGGRFAKVRTTVITGTDPIPRYPQMPAGSPWARDLVGQEPPIDRSEDGLRLGYRIDGDEPEPTPDDVGSGIRLRRRL